MRPHWTLHAWISPVRAIMRSRGFLLLLMLAAGQSRVVLASTLAIPRKSLYGVIVNMGYASSGIRIRTSVLSHTNGTSGCWSRASRLPARTTVWRQTDS